MKRKLLIGLALAGLLSSTGALAAYLETLSNTVCQVKLSTNPGVFQAGRCTGTFLPDTPTYRQTVLGDNPVSFWTMGDVINSSTLADQTGRNPGAQDNSAGATLGRPGAFANDSTTSWYNDLNNTYAEGRYWNVADSASLDLTSAVTVEVWFKNVAQYAGSYQQALVDKVPTYGTQYETNGGGGYGLWIRSYYGTAMFRICHFGTYDCSELDGATVVSLNTWHHLVGTYDGTTMKLYVDGALDASMTATKTLAVGNLPLRIGEQGDPDYFQSGYACTLPPQHGYCYPIDGNLQDIAIYNQALTAAQITAHWNARTAAGP